MVREKLSIRGHTYETRSDLDVNFQGKNRSRGAEGMNGKGHNALLKLEA
jgi:hypothetical protein